MENNKKDTFTLRGSYPTEVYFNDDLDIVIRQEVHYAENREQHVILTLEQARAVAAELVRRAELRP